MVREPANSHDPNAIAVWVDVEKKPHHLGYIPAGTAKLLARELDKGKRWYARVTHIEVHPDHPRNPGVWLTLERR